MDQLSPTDRGALQVAAILGQRFALDSLRSILDEPGYELDGLIVAREEGKMRIFGLRLFNRLF